MSPRHLLGLAFPHRTTAFAAAATCALGALAMGCSGAPASEDATSETSSDVTSGTIASIALANEGKGACSTNSRGGRGFDSSCTGNGGLPEYWCADFARWVWAQAGAKDTSQLTAAAGSFYVYGENHGTLSHTPEVGDAVVFNYRGGGYADHVALVTKVDSNGTIETISGDWDGQSGSEAHFSSTSHVVLDAPAYPGKVGDTPGVMGMTISGFVKPVGLSNSKPTAIPQRPTGCGAMEPGQGLKAGESYKSCDGRYELAMQTDGNLVWYGPHGALWATMTNGKGGYVAVMQGDGNFVEYDHESGAMWASGTDGHAGAHLSLQDDGNLVVYGPGGKPLWASNTVQK